MDVPRCLVVSEDAFLARLVHLVLNHGVYEQKVVLGIAEGTSLIGTWHPDLVVLDIDVEDYARMDIIGTWKKAYEPMPIIGLTRRDTMATRLEAFQGGIDDLLTIPFPPEELVARCIGVMKRVHHRDVEFRPEIEIDGLRIDLLHQRLRNDGQVLALTRTEAALLYVLAASAGEVIGREQLIEYMWGTDAEIVSNVVDRHVANLRTKLAEGGARDQLIETIPGRGYRFKGVEKRESGPKGRYLAACRLCRRLRGRALALRTG